MKRIFLPLGLSCLALVGAVERDARACGGCFHPPTQTVSDITDERMLLSVSPAQTSLYDQIQYSGNPTSFAWVLPIHGTVDVALSADVLFDSIDVLTETTIVSPEPTCAGPPAGCAFGADAGVAFGAAAPGAGGVTVTKQQNVGPYETVQLHATDPTALEDWLSQNGFVIPADVQPVVAEYVKEGFDFLAMKLLPDEGIQAMRPVRVTMPGASLSLPLRMAAVGTGATVGISIWVVSDGRYEPQNFPFFHIDDSELVWDWSTSSSNYTTLRAAHEQALGGKGWEIESSIDLSTQLITSVVLAGGVYYGNGFPSGVPSDASQDYLAVPGADGGIGETPDQVRNDDVTALVAGMPGPNVRITRMRSDISHAAMTTDFLLQASADQSELSNTRVVTKSINEQCPVYDNCEVVGTAPAAQAQAQTAQNDNSGKSSFSCAAASKRTGLDARVAFPIAGALGLIGASALRRRRRSKSKR